MNVSSTEIRQGLSASCADEYTRALLSFRLQGKPVPASLSAPASEPFAEPDSGQLEKQAHRVLTSVQRNAPRWLLVFGLGSGRVLDLLCQQLPESVSMLVCEPDIEHVRTVLAAGRLEWWAQGSTIGHLLADSSLWTHGLFWAGLGLEAGSTLAMVNPELNAEQRVVPNRMRRLFGQKTMEVPMEGPTECSMSAALIVHPDEPGLDDFFRAFPQWIDDIVCVWDGESVPAHAPVAARYRHVARPLNGDFAAQRNAALALCRGRWILALDADEQMPPLLWENLPRLCAAADTWNVSGWVFPRLTLDESETMARIGHGLWPDLQLRLFRKAEGVQYVQPVHEKVQGLERLGKIAVVLTLSILHFQHRKDAKALRAKLDVFSKASGWAVQHRLNAEYPLFVAQELPAGRENEGIKGLVLEDNPF